MYAIRSYYADPGGPSEEAEVRAAARAASIDEEIESWPNAIEVVEARSLRQALKAALVEGA